MTSFIITCYHYHDVQWNVYVWQHDDYCLQSQVDLCLFCIEYLYTNDHNYVGARCMSSVNQNVASLHCPRLPGFTMCIPVGTSDHHLLPIRKQDLVFYLELNVMIIS